MMVRCVRLASGCAMSMALVGLVSACEPVDEEALREAEPVVVEVEQTGAACHEGYASCFFRKHTKDGWQVVGSPVFDPQEVYKRG